jgi:DNA polymerase I-like protein with 3'-5' exonuclease and polymerase domains
VIDKHAAGQFTFDLPEPAVKQRTPPEGYAPIDDLPELSGDVVLDFETDDPGIGAKMGSSWARPGEGAVCGFSIAWRGGPAFYCPIAHGGGNGDGDKYLRWLKAQCAKPEVTIIGANVLYDIGWAYREGVELATPPVDVQGLAALLDGERSSYSLNSLLRSYLGRDKATDGLYTRAREYGITNPYLHMKRLPAWDVADYAIADAVDALELYDLMMPMIREQGLEQVLELERECLLIARDLRWRGVRVDQDAVARTMADFAAARDAAVARVKDLTGVNVAPWDAPSIARALEVENPEQPFERTSKGMPSIRAGLLEAMKSPVAEAVREARQYDKAINTALKGIMTHVARDGRVHGEFHPLRKTDDSDGGEGSTNGAGPGRWAASNPNLQNVPRRVPKIGTPIRRCFLPEEGEEWLKADYSSQEPRISTHYAFVARGYQDHRGRWHLPTEPHHPKLPLPGAQEMVEKYLANPEMSFHKEVGKAMGLGTSGPLYDALKVNNLALIYGLSGKSFAINNGYATKWVPRWDGSGDVEVAGDEAQAIIDKHTEAVPWGKPLAALMKEAAELRGYVRTITGRRIRYTRRDAQGRLFEARKALNNAVQGSAADQMKKAMVLFRRAGITPLVVVHDDGNFSKPVGEAGDRMMHQVAQIMADALPISVPSLAEMKCGPTWGDV